MRPRQLPAVLVLVVGCGGDDAPARDAGPVAPTPDLAREIVDTQLAFDLTALSATARVTFAPSDTPGASLEIGDLEIEGASVPFADVGAQLDLGVPASDAPIAVDVSYRFRPHEGFEGASAGGYTLVWPYWCGNLFPCHSAPSDGTTFGLELRNLPPGRTAVYPSRIASEAPSYQLAWAIASYSELDLGTTTAGTRLSVWHVPDQAAQATAGTSSLVAAFDWLEQHLGPYRFGDHAGAVQVSWGPGSFGGMEHHPYWHVAAGSIGDAETHAHEAAHGWFGDGIRIACWEDFVLSEGTVTYLAARVLDEVAPSAGAQAWAGYADELATLSATRPVWPDGCGAVDILGDGLFSRAPYIRGAFFYKAVADKVGVAALDQALAAFYAQHAGGAARMSDMLATIHDVTGYDPSACAQAWLRGTTKPTPGPCP